ncbi:hypothetical protein N9D23_10060 [Rubripirellula sp.]|jgi:hypothetical protein|nr:hypothetical protein [Rubripirellula sp.]MDF1845267.1 hypothetical protein [Rubripirellula sp.]
MSSKLSRDVSKIRAGWSEQERRERETLAGAMQLQLRALVVLSQLAADHAIVEKREIAAVASAC